MENFHYVKSSMIKRLSENIILMKADFIDEYFLYNQITDGTTNPVQTEEEAIKQFEMINLESEGNSQ